MSEERFIDLESRLAHQDHLLNELNDVVIRQQEKILQLDELLRTLTARVRAMNDDVAHGDAADERPPHY